MTIPRTQRNAILLKALRTVTGIISLDGLRSLTGMDAESVIESISDLGELGYPLRKHENGIELTFAPDFLFSWEFEGREDRIHYYPEIDSTMTEARKRAEKGCEPFTVIIAEQQSRGRGRLQRKWLSDTGGLYFTLVLRPDLPPTESGRVNFFISVTLASLLREEFGIETGVKWPNDILVGGRKVAGLLSELGTIDGRVNYVNVGIGLNVNNNPGINEPNAVSIKALLGKPVARAPLLGKFLDRIEAGMQPMRWEEILDAWRALSVTSGRPVKVVTALETVEGIAEDVDASGALLVRLPDGMLRKVIYGDCFLNS